MTPRVSRIATPSGVALALLALTAVLGLVGALVPGIVDDLVSRVTLGGVGVLCLVGVGFVAYDLAQTLGER